METCFVLVKGIKCPAHFTLAQNRTLAHWHIGSLKCRISQKRKMEPNIQKIIWPNQSRDKRLAKFCRKETKLINFSPPSPATVIVLKIAKRKLAAPPKSVATKRRVDGMSPLGRDFSQPISDAGCLQPCRKWPLRDESAMQAGVSPRYETTRNGQLGRHSRQISNLSFPAPFWSPVRQKMSPCLVLYGPILGA